MEPELTFISFQKQGHNWMKQLYITVEPEPEPAGPYIVTLEPELVFVSIQKMGHNCMKRRHIAVTLFIL